VVGEYQRHAYSRDKNRELSHESRFEIVLGVDKMQPM
jgi:hypothetical protein